MGGDVALPLQHETLEELVEDAVGMVGLPVHFVSPKKAWIRSLVGAERISDFIAVGEAGVVDVLEVGIVDPGGLEVRVLWRMSVQRQPHSSMKTNTRPCLWIKSNCHPFGKAEGRETAKQLRVAVISSKSAQQVVRWSRKISMERRGLKGG